MNALDLLLGNAELLKKPEKKFIVRRLSTEDTKFELTLTAITMDTFKHIQELHTKGREMDAIGIQVSMLAYGVRDFDRKDAVNKEKLDATFKAVGVGNIEQFIQKILLPGEISEVASAITDLSGFGGDCIEEVKN